MFPLGEGGGSNGKPQGTMGKIVKTRERAGCCVRTHTDWFGSFKKLESNEEILKFKHYLYSLHWKYNIASTNAPTYV